MKKHLLTVLMTTALWATVAIGAMADDVVGPPPPKPECKDIIYRKWNDLLFVDNGNEEFVGYQWYRNHNAIEGQTRQYLYTQGVILEGDNNIYHVVATRQDGSQVISCEGRFEDFSPSASLNPGQKIVKRAVLYSSSGEKVGEWTERPAQVSVAHGCYIWLLMDEKGNSWSERALY